MKDNKFTEIKNRTAYIQQLIIELEDVINEAELAETINTAKEGHRTLNEAPFLAASAVSAVNELDGYEDITEGKDHCLVKYFAGAVVILTIVYLLAQ